MAVDERARHQLFQRLEAVLGSNEAAILMEHLPPVGWADVATKRDLDVLAVTLEHKLGERFEKGLKDQAHKIYGVMAATVAAAMIAVAVLAFAAARLI